MQTFKGLVQSQVTSKQAVKDASSLSQEADNQRKKSLMDLHSSNGITALFQKKGTVALLFSYDLICAIPSGKSMGGMKVRKVTFEQGKFSRFKQEHSNKIYEVPKDFLPQTQVYKSASFIYLTRYCRKNITAPVEVCHGKAESFRFAKIAFYFVDEFPVRIQRVQLVRRRRRRPKPWPVKRNGIVRSTSRTMMRFSTPLPSCS